MKNNMLKVCALTALVMGGINMAHAASSTTVTVKGSVNTVTCDLQADKTDIDLGNYLPADFTTAGTFVANKTQDLKISLSGCSGTAGATTQASVQLSGPVTAAGATYFSDDSASQAAVGIANKATPTVLLANGAVVAAGAAGADSTALNNTTLDFTTGIISSVATNTKSGQQITAPLTFSFIYN